MSSVFAPVNRLSDSEEEAVADPTPKAKAKPKAKPKPSPATPKTKGKGKSKPKAKPKASPTPETAADAADAEGSPPAPDTAEPSAPKAKGKSTPRMKKPAAAKRPASAMEAEAAGGVEVPRFGTSPNGDKVSKVYQYKDTLKFACKRNGSQVFQAGNFYINNTKIMFPYVNHTKIIFSHQIFQVLRRLVAVVWTSRNVWKLLFGSQSTILLVGTFFPLVQAIGHKYLMMDKSIEFVRDLMANFSVSFPWDLLFGLNVFNLRPLCRLSSLEAP